MTRLSKIRLLLLASAGAMLLFAWSGETCAAAEALPGNTNPPPHDSPISSPSTQGGNGGSDGPPTDEPSKQRRRRGDRRKKSRKERLKRIRKTKRELDSVYSEFAKRLKKLRGGPVGVAYVRYSTKFQDSAAAQLRRILEEAVAKGIYIARSMIFFDLAVRGSTGNRPGLDQATEALETGAAKVLLAFSTNRLFRKSYLALRFMEEVVHTWNARAIFVRDNIDTDDPHYQCLNYHILAAVDEHMSKVYAENVIAEHVKCTEDELVMTTMTFGYYGEELDGPKTKRGLPRRRWQKDEKAAEYVCQIFDWFLADVEIDEIVRRLNHDSEAPLPPRSDGEWTRLAVVTVLHNERYRGFLLYGEEESVDIPGKDYVGKRKRDEPLVNKYVSRLRIISDEVWFAAQEKLKGLKDKFGRKSKDGDRKSRPTVFRGLFYCPPHDQPLYVGGAHGRYLLCPCCRRMQPEKRTLFSHLNRRFALESLIDSIVPHLLADEFFISQVVQNFRDCVDRLQRPEPAQLSRLRKEDLRLANAIKFAKEDPGETDFEQQETKDLLKQLRADREKVQAKLSNIQRMIDDAPVAPTEDEVREILKNAADLLRSAVDSEDEEQLRRVSHLLKLLTGGRIELFQRGKKSQNQGWLEGRFRLQLLSLIGPAGPTSQLHDDFEGPEIVIQFKKPEPVNDEADRAYEMFQRDMLEVEIAEELGCSRSKVTKLLEIAYELRGEVKPDGRKRKSRLAKKQRTSPLYELRMDDVMRLWHEDKLNEEIAEELGICRDSVTKIVRRWHEAQDLPVPDGRARRKRLLRKQRFFRRKP